MTDKILVTVSDLVGKKIVMDGDTRKRIGARIDQLCTMRKMDLILKVREYYRIIDTSGMTKDEAIAYIMEAEFGQRKMDAFYSPETYVP
jgi:hypothetical protein